MTITHSMPIFSASENLFQSVKSQNEKELHRVLSTFDIDSASLNKAFELACHPMWPSGLCVLMSSMLAQKKWTAIKMLGPLLQTCPPEIWAHALDALSQIKPLHPKETDDVYSTLQNHLDDGVGALDEVWFLSDVSSKFHRSTIRSLQSFLGHRPTLPGFRKRWAESLSPEEAMRMVENILVLRMLWKTLPPDDPSKEQNDSQKNIHLMLSSLSEKPLEWWLQAAQTPMDAAIAPVLGVCEEWESMVEKKVLEHRTQSAARRATFKRRKI